MRSAGIVATGRHYKDAGQKTDADNDKFGTIETRSKKPESTSDT